MPQAYDLVTTAAALTEAVQQMSQADWLAVDTEFAREDTYYPQLCLVQVATATQNWIIDPQALDDLSPLFAPLTNPAITKVLHASSQDLELFFQLIGSVPAPIFDTQQAAALLGYPEQVGYANLVSGELDINLPKAHSRSDWRKRPLTDAELDYAANDVIYLAKIYPKMLNKLTERGRLGWLEAGFAELSQASKYQVTAERAWLKVKGAKRLRKRPAAAAQVLAAWRETLAQEQNKPKGWILRDDVLCELASRRPSNSAEAQRIGGLKAGVWQRHGDTLLQLLADAPEEPTAGFEEHKPPAPLSPAREAVVDVLTGVLKMTAAEQDIAAGSLANRKDLEQIVRGNEDAKPLRGWRRAAVGERLLAVRDGELPINIYNASLRLGSESS